MPQGDKPPVIFVNAVGCKDVVHKSVRGRVARG
jgi:hypothetical protein